MDNQEVQSESQQILDDAIQESIVENVIESESSKSVQAVDAETIRQVIKEELTKWNEEQWKLRQKLRDKINHEVEQKIEALRMAGVTPTEEHIEAIRRGVSQKFNDTFGIVERPAESDVVARQEVAETQQEPQQELDPIAQVVLSLFNQYGVVLNEDDPEVEMVDLETKSQGKFLLSVEEAIKAKKARLENRRSKPAASPSLTTKGSSSTDLIEKYKQEMIAARGQGHAVGREIREKYRKLGVPVDNIGFTILP